MVFYFLFSFVFSYNPLEDFLDRDVRIFASKANHVFLLKDLDDNSFIWRSKFALLDNVLSSFRISKVSNSYSIQSNQSFLCGKNNKIEFCESEKTWKITPVTYGYTISKGNLCLTCMENYKMSLSSCVSDESQIFDFKLANEDCESDNSNKEAQTKINIKINNASPKDKPSMESDSIIKENMATKQNNTFINSEQEPHEHRYVLHSDRADDAIKEKLTITSPIVEKNTSQYI